MTHPVENSKTREIGVQTAAVAGGVPEDISCPRCGYDLRGQHTAWDVGATNCAVCSECGLGFEWADVLDAKRRDVPGFVEHSRGFWATLHAAWGTLWWLLRPPQFWRRIRLEAPIRPQRWWVWLSIVMGAAWAVSLVVDATAIVWMRSKYFFPPVGLLTYIQQSGVGGVPQAFASAICAPLVELPDAEFVASHVTGWDRVDWDERARWWDGSYAVNRVAPGLGDLITVFRWPAPLVCALFLSIVMPVTLLGLPTVRRIARVRKAHVARAAVYGCAVLLPFFALNLIRSIVAMTAVKLAISGRGFTPGIWQDILRSPSINWEWWTAVVVIWLALYWRGAVRSWRLSDQRDPNLALVVIFVLSVVVFVLPQIVLRLSV